MRHHCALITVHCNTRGVEGFLGMFQVIVEIRHATFKNTSEVAWDECPTYRWNTKSGKLCKCYVIENIISLCESYITERTNTGKEES